MFIGLFFLTGSLFVRDFILVFAKGGAGFVSGLSTPISVVGLFGVNGVQPLLTLFLLQNKEEFWGFVLCGLIGSVVIFVMGGDLDECWMMIFDRDEGVELVFAIPSDEL